MKIGSLIKLRDSWVSVNMWQSVNDDIFNTVSPVCKLVNGMTAIVVDHKFIRQNDSRTKILLNDRCGWVSTFFIEEIKP